MSDQPSSPHNARGFELTGPSAQPDPARSAFRKDLADIDLAGVVIASHYAAPVERRVAIQTVLYAQPSETSAPLAQLEAEEVFGLLDDSLGWAWGYAGTDRLVGYVRSDCLTK